MRKHHIHKCPGFFELKKSLFKEGHQKHFWLCWNPNCKAGKSYLCGIICDAILACRTVKKTIKIKLSS